MSALTWDETGNRLYETGISKCVLYVRDAGTDHNEYAAGVAWNGITAVNESPEGGDANEIYADNIKYLDLRSVEKLNLTIEAYTYPDRFMECDGSIALTTGVYGHQQTRKSFGLCYRTEIGNDTDGDSHGYKLHLVYGCTCSPSEKSYSTINDSPEAINFSWEVTTIPESDGNTAHKPMSLITIDSTKADPGKLAALEAKLYGGQNTDPTLPLPSTVITDMTPPSSP